VLQNELAVRTSCRLSGGGVGASGIVWAERELVYGPGSGTLWKWSTVCEAVEVRVAVEYGETAVFGRRRGDEASASEMRGGRHCVRRVG
jgi:hypothetical protein